MNWFNGIDLFGYELVMMLFAFIMSGIIGLERQARHKAAGFRTHILVGVASCLFTLVSLYGYSANVSDRWDGSRIAAQIVSGVGFLGAGVIFLNRDVIRGLTTAASVWLVSAVGMSCGAGIPQLGLVALILHLLAIVLAPQISKILPDLGARALCTIEYEPNRGVLRRILEILEKENQQVMIREIEHYKDNDLVILTLDCASVRERKRVIQEVEEIPGIISAKEETE